MKFHSYSEIFPLIDGAEFDSLVEDIKAHGLREKIWLYEGKILDGRNRFLACQKAKVKPLYRKFTGKDALAFIVSLNVQRRHLTEAQRAMAAARIASLAGKGRPENASRGAFKSQSEAAEELDVSRRSVQRAKQVIEKGSKALQQAVESGDVPLKKAAEVTSLPKTEQLKAATHKPAEVTPEPELTDFEPDDDEEYQARIENVMMADDKLAAMREELKKQQTEINGLKASRDHYQTEAGEAVRLLKARDREVERLKRDLEKARNENEALRERVAMMEAA